MPSDGFCFDTTGAALEAYLLGQLDFERCLNLQQRLVQEAGSRNDGRVSLLLCEHPNLITVGRSGSAAGLAMDSPQVRNGQIQVRWVKRGGGCLVHTPGQLAVYPILPLEWHGMSVGQYLSALQGAVLRTLAELGVNAELRPPHQGVWGRTGQLAAFGVAVEDWVAYHGAFINVSPTMGLFRLLDTGLSGQERMSSLVAERQRPVKMTSVRAELVRQMSEAFGCDRCHLYTGHPLLK
jgi:lipoyl(octanoyl) transferase